MTFGNLLDQPKIEDGKVQSKEENVPAMDNLSLNR
jgi:hypothetical protein